MDEDTLLPITSEGYTGKETMQIQSVKFIKMGFTPEEFDTYWAMVEEADMRTPWPSETTVDDIYRIFRSMWYPQKRITDILTELESVLVNRGLIG